MEKPEETKENGETKPPDPNDITNSTTTPTDVDQNTETLEEEPIRPKNRRGRAPKSNAEAVPVTPVTRVSSREKRSKKNKNGEEENGPVQKVLKIDDVIDQTEPSPKAGTHTQTKSHTLNETTVMEHVEKTTSVDPTTEDHYLNKVPTPAKTPTRMIEHEEEITPHVESPFSRYTNNVEAYEDTFPSEIQQRVHRTPYKAPMGRMKHISHQANEPQFIEKRSVSRNLARDPQFEVNYNHYLQRHMMPPNQDYQFTGLREPVRRPRVERSLSLTRNRQDMESGYRFYSEIHPRYPLYAASNPANYPPHFKTERNYSEMHPRYPPYAASNPVNYPPHFKTERKVIEIVPKRDEQTMKYKRSTTSEMRPPAKVSQPKVPESKLTEPKPSTSRQESRTPGFLPVDQRPLPTLGTPSPNAPSPSSHQPIHSSTNKRNITVREIKNTTVDGLINRRLSVKVVELQEKLPPADLVPLARRKIAICDETGDMVVYLKKSTEVCFKKGDSIIVSCFRIYKGDVLLNDNTSISRTPSINVPPEIEDMATVAMTRPKTPVRPINQVLRQNALTPASIEGTVTKVQPIRKYTEKKEGAVTKLVRDVTIRDGTGEAHLALWEAACAYLKVMEGDRVRVLDATVSGSKKYGETKLTVSHADKVKILSPLEEEIKGRIIALDRADNQGRFVLLLEGEGNRPDQHLQVEASILSNGFGFCTIVDVDDVIPFLPCQAKLRVSGIMILDMSVVQIPDQNTPSHLHVSDVLVQNASTPTASAYSIPTSFQPEAQEYVYDEVPRKYLLSPGDFIELSSGEDEEDEYMNAYVKKEPFN